MSKRPVIAGVAILASALGFAGWWWRGVLDSGPRYSFARDIEPVLIRYCYACHGEGMDKGGVALDAHQEMAALLSDRKLWLGVHGNVEGHLMPPGDRDQPTDGERRMMVAWIERDVFKLDPKRPDPGRVRIRRLNRDEYNNTVRDLVGVDLRPADRFPEDDSGYGFDNVGDVLSLSPALMERYLSASGEILDAAIVTEAPAPRVVEIDADQFRGLEGIGNGSGHLASNAKVGVRLNAPLEGEYQVAVLAGGSPAHNEWPLMRVIIGSGPRKDFRVQSPEEGPRWFSQNVRLKAGEERAVEMSFLNDAYDPGAKDPRQRDRNLAIRRVRVTGPLSQPVPPPNEAHRRLFSVADAGLPEVDRAWQIIHRFAERAWRRPVDKAEMSRLFRFYENSREVRESFDAGVKLALQAVMMSPNFLFRGEVQPDPDNPASMVEIDEFSLASRLSYFLWSTMPDDELLDLARTGRLRASLNAQIERLLADPRAVEALTKNFAGQWLQLRNLRLVTPDRETYPAWSDELREAMRGESEHFFAAIARDNRSVLEFLDADYTWVNERLAEFYGLPATKGDAFQRVILSGDLRSQRGGVLTQAGILTLTSNPTRTSAVNRGNYVLENLLGTPPPPPPDGVDIPPLEASGKGANQGKSLRQQLEAHRSKAMCASCHARMDPIGFGLENFDGIGAWRDRESGKPVDASGALHTGESFSGLRELRAILVESRRETFVRNLSEKLLTYALGRGVEYYDKPAIHRISEETVAGEYRFHRLVKAVVESVPFQMRRGDGAGSEP